MTYELVQVLLGHAWSGGSRSLERLAPNLEKQGI